MANDWYDVPIGTRIKEIDEPLSDQKWEFRGIIRKTGGEEQLVVQNSDGSVFAYENPCDWCVLALTYKLELEDSLGNVVSTICSEEWLRVMDTREAYEVLRELERDILEQQRMSS